MYSEQFETKDLSNIELRERIGREYDIKGESRNGYTEFNIEGTRVRVNSGGRGRIEVISDSKELTKSASEVSNTLKNLSIKLEIGFSFVN